MKRQHFTSVDPFDFGEAVADLIIAEGRIFEGHPIEQQQRCWDDVWDQKEIKLLTMEEHCGWSDAPTSKEGRSFRQWRIEAESCIAAKLDDEQRTREAMEPRQ